MRKHTLQLMGLLSVALALLLPQRAAANDDDDPPSRVARLSYVRGAVSFEPAGTDDWVDALLNRPITLGDKLWTDRDARAELHIDNGVIRLAGNTGLSFLNLDDRMVQIRLTEGTLNLRVRRLENDDTLEVDTPNLAFSVLRPGNYKIFVNENGDSTIVTVRDGQGEVTGGGSAYTIHSREEGRFSGVDELSADISRFGDGDDFDSWCADRDRREDRSVSARYVSTDVIGYEDLDDYGGWRDVPDYGNVWFPHTTVVGWAPYRYGHWVWISPWGWTWVDDEPWGFAPFHYGRWVVVRGVWGWVPCPPRPAVVTVAYVRPVYAPALVAWIGGPHFSVGIGVGGGVGWVPLGPREVYIPSYHVSPVYVNRVNISNTTVNNTYVTNVYNNYTLNKNVTNITYVNRTAPNGVTVTSQNVFTDAQPVGRNIVRVDQRQIASAQVAPVAPAVVPQQRSVIGAGAEARVRPPAALQSRAVVAKTAPPPARVPFAQQQQAIQANGGRPIAISQERQMAPPDQQARRNVRIAPEASIVTAPPAVSSNANRPNAQPVPQGRPVDHMKNNPRVNQDQGAPASASPNMRTDRPPSVQPSTPAPINNVPANTNVPPGRSDANRPPDARANRPPQPVDRVNRSDRQIDPQLQQRQIEEKERLRQQQDKERQRVEQQQIEQQRKLDQKNADDHRRQQVEQQQQQKLQQLEQKHNREQQELREKQRREERKSEQPERENKPPKNDNTDKPHYRG